MAQVSDFNYELPEELIAQEPLRERTDSRMLVLSREKQTIVDDLFANFPRYVRQGDCLVLNNTRVFPARLHGRRHSESGALVEVFLIRELAAQADVWRALVRPGKRVRSGDRIIFSPELVCEVLSQGEFGERTIRFLSSQPVRDLVERIGQVPLPPYIHRAPVSTDQDRYQTIFAQSSGSVAAPTAGLHFTPQVLDSCREAGAQVAYVTLHVGLGTFAPLRATRVEDIRLHAEAFELTEANASIIRSAERLICVGSTSVRTIETVLSRGEIQESRGETCLFISPGYKLMGTGAILTNFHLPQSSLLMLVCAFGGQELVLAAYRHAVAAKYRFFSYGDCMLIL